MELYLKYSDSWKTPRVPEGSRTSLFYIRYFPYRLWWPWYIHCDYYKIDVTLFSGGTHGWPKYDITEHTLWEFILKSLQVPPK